MDVNAEVRKAAEDHAHENHGHLTAFRKGEGWMCATCDPDFGVWLDSEPGDISYALTMRGRDAFHHQIGRS